MSVNVGALVGAFSYRIEGPALVLTTRCSGH